MAEKLRWNNDYNRGAHPAILEALAATNDNSYGGYGLDEWCEKATAEIKKHLACDSAEIHFLLGGTQVNYTVIAAALRPYQGVISADTAHIHVHETGAVENADRKILALPAEKGKLTAARMGYGLGSPRCDVALAERHIFEYEARIDNDRHCIRFCTSWGTKGEDVDALIADIAAL